jgi:hypothetical protein
MFLGEIEANGPLACLTQQVDPHHIRKHPPRRRLVHPWTLLVGKRGLMLVERLADTVFHGRVDPQPPRPHHPQRHEALGRVARARGGDKLRVLQQSEPAFRLSLAFVAGHHRWWWQVGGLECIGGQEATPVLVDEGLSGRA